MFGVVEGVMAGNRQQLIQELMDFNERCQSQLNELLRDLGWKEEHPESHQMAICPYDSNHSMPVSSLDKHVSVCRLRQLGYSKKETDVCDPNFFYEKAVESRVVFDKAKQFQIIKDAKDRAPNTSENGSWEKSVYSSSPVEVPLNYKRAICDLTSADRLAIYDYVIQKTKDAKPAPEISESDLFEDLTAKIKRDDDQKCPKSHLEIMAEMRDYKRRRQSYRAKNVHITKKSYTEIIRDVINVHMKELSNTGDDELQDDSSSTVSSSSVKRREHNRSPSVESRQSGGSRRNRAYSGRRRELSRSPRRHRSQDRDRELRRKRDRDEDRYHGHKR